MRPVLSVRHLLTRNPQRWIPLVVFLVIWGLTTHGKYSVSGDEPHYLMVTESLLNDGDWDLENNHAVDAGRRFGRPGVEPAAHVQRDRYGALAPVHDLGLSVFLLPLYALAVEVSEWVPVDVLRRFRMSPGLFAYSLISLALLALSCVGLALLIASLRLADPVWGPAVAFLTALAPPFLSVSFLVFPEVPAWFVSCALLWLTYGPGRSRDRSPIGVGLLLGTLPWFHRKFALLAVGLLLLYGWTRWTSVEPEKRWSTLRRAATGFLLPVSLLVVFTAWRWGTIAGPLTSEGMPFSGSSLVVGLVGTFVDRENGLIVWAPMYAALPAAFWLSRRQTAGVLPTIVAVVFLSAAHLQWWGGFSPSARFLLPLVPWFAWSLALAARDRTFRIAVVWLLLPQVLIAAYGWQKPRVLWPQGDGHNRALEAWRLGEAVSASLPSFRTDSVAWISALPWISGLVIVNLLLVLAIERQHRHHRQVRPQ